MTNEVKGVGKCPYSPRHNSTAVLDGDRLYAGTSADYQVCSTVQYSTVQYSTVQYSTVQYSKVQYCTVTRKLWNMKSTFNSK